jgi:hypothetical protein
LVLCSVKIGECARDIVTACELLAVDQRLEKSAADNLETFLGTSWCPRRFDAANDVSEST